MSKAGKGGDEWGPWIVHDGQGCPVQQGTVVEVVSVDGFGFAMRSQGQVSGESPSSWDWHFYPKMRKIIRYRKRHPKGLQILLGVLQSRETPKQPRLVES